MVAAVTLQSSAKRRPWGDIYPVKSSYPMSFPVFDFFASPKNVDLFSVEDSRTACYKNLGTEYGDDCLSFHSEKPLPPGWEQCLDLKTGKMYYVNRISGVQTSCDPRSKMMTPATLLNNNWPASPATSDLTVEANQVFKGRSTILSELNELNTMPASETIDSNNLDLTLTLRPAKPLAGKESRHDHFQHHQMEKQHTDVYTHIQDRMSSFANTERSQFSWKQSRPAMKLSNNKCVLNPAQQRVEPKSFNINERSTNSEIRASRPLIDLENILNQDLQRSNTVIKGLRQNDGSVDGEDAMITVGCSNCLMYVMVPQKSSQKCPKCGCSFSSTNPPEQSPPKRARVELSLMH